MYKNTNKKENKLSENSSSYRTLLLLFSTISGTRNKKEPAVTLELSFHIDCCIKALVKEAKKNNPSTTKKMPMIASDQ